MAQEIIRACGYRKVDGLYLVGDGIFTPCDRLPLEIGPCPCCGGVIKAGRGMAEINPHKYFGDHKHCVETEYIRCMVCEPPDETAYIMMVGEQFYPKASDFYAEARRQGISKRIAHLPKKFKVGITPIYLAHPTALQTMIDPKEQPEAEVLPGFEPETKKHKRNSNQPRLLDTVRIEKKPAIFMAFIPQRLEKLIWERDADEKTLNTLKKQGITPVIIKNGDVDHKPKKEIKW